jgi:hypothetical protein
MHAVQTLKQRTVVPAAVGILSLLLKQRLVLLLGLDESILEQVGVVWVGKADGKSLGLGFAFADIGSSIPDPGAIGSNVGGQFHVGDN